jgi:hypothetical protein
VRCRTCGEKWTLEVGLGPGGAASPGVVLVVAGVLAAIAAGAGLYCLIVEPAALAFVMLMLLGGIALWFFLISCARSGYHHPSTAYQGSVCPKCGVWNWIWPWDF